MDATWSNTEYPLNGTNWSWSRNVSRIRIRIIEIILLHSTMCNRPTSVTIIFSLTKRSLAVLVLALQLLHMQRL